MSSRSTPWQDALRVSSEYVTTCEYDEKVDLCEGVSAVFTDAGHLLGSASITLDAAQKTACTRRSSSPAISATWTSPLSATRSFFNRADYVVMESHLRRPQPHRGVELHRRAGADHRRDARQGRQRGHPVLRRGPHPGAAVLYPRDQGSRAWSSPTPNFPVYIDSPLAKAATTIFCGDLHGYLDEEALELVKDGTHMFTFPNLHLTETVRGVQDAERWTRPPRSSFPPPVCATPAASATI